MSKIGDHKFVAFRHDPQVCDECGQLFDDHELAEPSGSNLARRKAMWNVMLRHGGLHNFYGGTTSPRDPTPVLEHLKQCEVDWKLTLEPRMDDLEFFSGTFATSNDRATLLVGSLYCRCRQIFYQTMCVNDMTLGQLIWHVVREEGELP